LAKPIVFFAASRNQRDYFTPLSQHIDLPSRVVWYKKLGFNWPCFNFPFGELLTQARLLTVRKRHSPKGKKFPGFIWPIKTGFALIEALWLYSQYSAWVKHIPEAFIGVWNGKKFRQAILVLAIKANGKQVIFFERGPLPGYSAIDPKGVNFYSSIPNSLGFYQTRTLKKSAPGLISAASHSRPAYLPDKYVLVPFQVVEDSNIYLHSKWVRTMRQLFSMCEQVSKILPDDIVFVFKEHPACHENYDDLRQCQSNQLRFIDEFSTSELVDYADAVLTVNSTVGIEGLMHGLPVIVLGDALFGVEGISFPVTSQKELERALSQLSKLKPDLMALKSFIDYLKNDYAILGDAMSAPDEAHWLAANKRLRLLLTDQAPRALGLTS